MLEGFRSCVTHQQLSGINIWPWSFQDSPGLSSQPVLGWDGVTLWVIIMLQGPWYLHLHPTQKVWAPTCPLFWWPSSVDSSFQRTSLQESLPGHLAGQRDAPHVPCSLGVVLPLPVFSHCSSLSPLLFPRTLLAGLVLLRFSELCFSGISHHPHSHTRTHSQFE